MVELGEASLCDINIVTTHLERLVMERLVDIAHKLWRTSSA